MDPCEGAESGNLKLSTLPQASFESSKESECQDCIIPFPPTFLATLKVALTLKKQMKIWDDKNSHWALKPESGMMWGYFLLSAQAVYWATDMFILS